MNDRLLSDMTEEEKERVRKQYSNAVHFAMNSNPPDAREARCVIEVLEQIFGKDFFKRY